jgi:hypothetical protein
MLACSFPIGQLDEATPDIGLEFYNTNRFTRIFNFFFIVCGFWGVIAYQFGVAGILTQSLP